MSWPAHYDQNCGPDRQRKISSQCGSRATRTASPTQHAGTLERRRTRGVEHAMQRATMYAQKPEPSRPNSEFLGYLRAGKAIRAQTTSERGAIEREARESKFPGSHWHDPCSFEDASSRDDSTPDMSESTSFDGRRKHGPKHETDEPKNERTNERQHARKQHARECDESPRIRTDDNRVRGPRGSAKREASE